MIAHVLALLSVTGLPEAPSGTLTLDHAVELARSNLPALRVARAQTEAARSTHDEALSAFYPNLTGTMAYKRGTGNLAASPGSIPSAFTNRPFSWNTYNTFTNSLSATELLWDFGQGLNKLRATDETAQGALEAEHVALRQAELAVRVAFFGTAAQKDLVTVAEVNLKNNEAHLAQTKAFVAAGTQPEIDVAASEANRANAVVQLITARNNYATAKTKLNQAMGVVGRTAYEIAPPPAEPIRDEDAALDQLFSEALATRPEEAELQAQRRSAAASIRAQGDAWFPTLTANASVSDNGTTVDLNHTQDLSLMPNLSVGLALNWSVNLGPYIPAAVRVAEAQFDQVDAQLDALHLQVRVDLETAQLAVQAAKESLVAANEARDAANVQLKLAEGRYNAGVGNQVELGDAQLAADQAGAQAVQARFTLATARAQLVEALGRP